MLRALSEDAPSALELLLGPRRASRVVVAPGRGAVGHRGVAGASVLVLLLPRRHLPGLQCRTAAIVVAAVSCALAAALLGAQSGLPPRLEGPFVAVRFVAMLVEVWLFGPSLEVASSSPVGAVPARSSTCSSSRRRGILANVITMVGYAVLVLTAGRVRRAAALPLVDGRGGHPRQRVRGRLGRRPHRGPAKPRSGRRERRLGAGARRAGRAERAARGAGRPAGRGDRLAAPAPPVPVTAGGRGRAAGRHGGAGAAPLPDRGRVLRPARVHQLLQLGRARGGHGGPRPLLRHRRPAAPRGAGPPSARSPATGSWPTSATRSRTTTPPAPRSRWRWRCGVRCGEVVAGWRRRGFDLGCGMGIAYGYATIGPVGFDERTDYTALGPTVNLASRLCSMAADGEILIDGRAYEAVEGRVARRGAHRRGPRLPPAPVHRAQRARVVRRGRRCRQLTRGGVTPAARGSGGRCRRSGSSRRRPRPGPG